MYIIFACLVKLISYVFLLLPIWLYAINFFPFQIVLCKYTEIKLILMCWFVLCNSAEFVSLNDLWWILQGFLYVRSCHLWKEITTSSFHFRCLFFSFSCLIGLARTSNTVLNRSGKWASLSFLILEEELSVSHYWVY